MKKFLLFLIVCFLISPLILLSQFGQGVWDYSTKNGRKEAFIEAEAYVLFEEYNEALPNYQELINIDSTNHNYNYRIGLCYLNTPGEKEKSIDFLRKAVRNINPKYKEGRFKEKKAPTDAYFYLGNAFRVTNQLDSALVAYQKFKEILNPKIYDENLVDEQIQACLNAKKLQEKPLFLEYENLGPIINTRFTDLNPVISGDQKTIVYVQRQQFDDYVFYSKKIDGEWSPPYNMAFELGGQDFYSSSLSYDGATLYLYRLDNYDGNIYVSRFSDSIWTRAEKLNDNINTKYWESHASISKDGQTLYFTSNRKDGYGALDIYKSEIDTTGDWGPAVNLGAKINTSYNEESPFISADGKTLYFSSYGHYNMGGYDIFYSNLLENNEWSVPLNMGYPINTPDDDLFYVPTEEDYYAYYSKFPEEGYGGRDVLRLEIFSDEHPRKFLVQGIFTLTEFGQEIDETFTITILRAVERDTVGIIKPDLATGEYEFELIEGDYEMVFEGESFEQEKEFISLVYDQKDSELSIPETKLVLKDTIAELEIEDSIYTVDNIDTVKIKLTLEKDSKLNVDAYLDTSLVNSDEFDITLDEFTYHYVPVEGKNILKLKLVDKFRNTSKEEILVALIPRPVEKPLIEKPEVKPDITEKIPPEQVAVEEPAIKPSPDKNLEGFYNNLKTNAHGEIKAALENINLEKTGILTSKELVDYLKDQTEEYNYKKEDIDSLVTITATKGEMSPEEFLNCMIEESEGNLKTTLENLDLKTQNITSNDQLIKYLLTNAEKEGYDEQGVYITVGEIAAIMASLVELTVEEYKTIQADNLKEKADGKWILWVAIPLVLLIIIYIILKRQKRKTD
jgi:hypothetical protein